MPDLSVVVPVYNEAENILPLIAEITDILGDTYDYEVIYVDDGSQDATAAELTAALGAFPRLRVLRHAQCCGQSTAMWSGIKAARGAWVVTLDGDGQNDPADIVRLWNCAQQELHLDPRPLMVAGARRKRRDSRWRRVCSQSANRILQVLLNYDTPDTGCSLKICPRSLYLSLPYFDHMHRFLPALVIRAGGRVKSLEVNHRPRQRGVSKYGTFKRLGAVLIDMFGVFWLLHRNQRPVVIEVGHADSV